MLSPFPKHVLSFALAVMIVAGCGGGGGGTTPSSPANPQLGIAIPARTIPSTGSGIGGYQDKGRDHRSGIQA